NHISEYSYNSTYKVSGVPPNSGYASGAPYMNSYSIINGTVQTWTTAFPVTPTITQNSSAPPANLVSEHLWQNGYPSYNGAAADPQTVVVATNVGWFGGITNCNLILQSNIDYASTNAAYHGRVFLPSGSYWISNTLTLHTNTVFMGAGWGLSWIQADSA